MARNFSSTRDERNRKERKARYIRLKNKMRKYPECNYGEFFCNHVYDPAHPWQWVDFSFFHSKARRYYSVAMTTLNYAAWDAIESKVLDETQELYLHGSNKARARFEELLKQQTIGTPSIELKNYGPVVIGLWATVNTPHIDEHIIRDFITFFRGLGEPTQAGWTWRGQETQIDPSKLLRNSTP